MEILGTAARALLKLFKWLSIIVIALIGVVFAINAFDETLKPEAAAALRWPEPTVKDGDNGFFALVGLSAPPGQDAHAWGRRWVEAMNRARSRAEVEAAENTLAAAPRKFAGASTVLCDFHADQSCAPQAAQHAEAIGKLTVDNAELLGRYSGVRGFPQVVDVYRPHSLSHPMIGVSTYGFAQRLLLTQGLGDIDRDAGGAALATVAGDIDLQRKVLAGAASLIVKMVANAALARDYRALAEIIRRHPQLAGAPDETMRRILAPLSRDELALAPAIMAEFRAMAGILDDPAIADPASYQLIQVLGDASAASAPPVGRPAPSILKASVLDAAVAPLMTATVKVLLQKNATRNRQFEALQAFAAFDEVPATGLGDAERAVPVRPDEGVNWRWVYNPIGKLILSVAVPSFSDYKRRLLDVEGLRRLVALQAQIAARRVADADIPAFLAASDGSLANPYSGKPMSWDADGRALVFFTATNSRWFVVGKDGRITVPI